MNREVVIAHHNSLAVQAFRQVSGVEEVEGGCIRFVREPMFLGVDLRRLCPLLPKQAGSVFPNLPSDQFVCFRHCGVYVQRATLHRRWDCRPDSHPGIRGPIHAFGKDPDSRGRPVHASFRNAFVVPCHGLLGLGVEVQRFVHLSWDHFVLLFCYGSPGVGGGCKVLPLRTSVLTLFLYFCSARYFVVERGRLALRAVCTCLCSVGWVGAGE